MTYVTALFYIGAFDENIFMSIQTHQDGLERPERHPEGVQRVKNGYHEINI